MSVHSWPWRMLTHSPCPECGRRTPRLATLCDACFDWWDAEYRLRRALRGAGMSDATARRVIREECEQAENLVAAGDTPPTVASPACWGSRAPRVASANGSRVGTEAASGATAPPGTAAPPRQAESAPE